MTKYVYTIFDKVAQESGPLMVFNNDEHAIRVYPQAFKGQEHPKFEDFMLCCLGSFDVNTMVFVPHDIPHDITPSMIGGE